MSERGIQPHMKEKEVSSQAASFAAKNSEKSAIQEMIIPGDLAYLAIVGGAVAGAVGEVIYSRRKRSQWGKLYRKMDVNKFKDSPNVTAELFSKNVNISIHEKPKRVVYNRKNKRIFRRHDPKSASYVKDAFKGGAPGVFEGNYNVFFVKKRAGVRTEIHENAHSLLGQMNPELKKWYEEYNEKEKKINYKNIEKNIAFECFNEGMAIWLEHYIALKDGSVKNAGVNSNIFEYRPNAEIPFVVLPLYQEQHAIEEVEELRADIYRQRKEKQSKKIEKQANALLRAIRYHVGASFVDASIRKQMDEGKSVQEAVTAMIKNPPTDPEEFFDAGRYIQEKLPKPQPQPATQSEPAAVA